jgi:hypothetical protein
MTTQRLYSSEELGEDGYPPEWHETIKHAVREAAGDRCVRCLHPYVKGAGEWSPCDKRCGHDGPIRYSFGREHFCDFGTIARRGWPALDERLIPLEIDRSEVSVEARWRILTVHHLDGNKANCRWWNLAALCQRCHLTIQGRVRMERVYPWPHSDWFKPYVAGYYAFAYLGEDLDRPSVDARLDELLALELAGRVT